VWGWSKEWPAWSVMRGHNGYGIRSTKDYKRKEWIDIYEGAE